MRTSDESLNNDQDYFIYLKKMYPKEVTKKSKPNNGKKRSKKSTWGSRERTSMSFLLVIAFFAIFGIIILTEVCDFISPSFEFRI